MLEPRRLAARAAARRMAELLGEEVGGTVGYAMRFDRRIGRDTRIEVVTEGLLTRQLQRDPALEAYGAVIFDEFHERSLDADLGLALCLEVQASLRPDLQAAASCRRRSTARARGRHLGERAGGAQRGPRSSRSQVEHLGGDPAEPLELRAPRAVELALAASPAACWCSCPVRPRSGARRRCSRHGWPRRRRSTRSTATSRAPSRMRRSAPAPGGGARSCCATNIAETSLTIEGVAVVIDARPGAARPVLAAHRHEPAGHRADQPRLGRAARAAAPAGSGPACATACGRAQEDRGAAGAPPGRDRGRRPGTAGARAGGLGRARPRRAAPADPAAGGAVRAGARPAARAGRRSTTRRLDHRAWPRHGRAAAAPASRPHGACAPAGTAWPAPRSRWRRYSAAAIRIATVPTPTSHGGST